MTLMPCGHPEQAVVSSDEGTSYCAVCEGQAFSCADPEAKYIADLRRSLPESASQDGEASR